MEIVIQPLRARRQQRRGVEQVGFECVELVGATRPAKPSAVPIAKEYVEWGAGPRASQYRILGAKALALLNGKLTPETEDVRQVAVPVLQHRVFTNYRATGAGKKSRDVIEHILKNVKEKEY